MIIINILSTNKRLQGIIVRSGLHLGVPGPVRTLWAVGPMQLIGGLHEAHTEQEYGCTGFNT